MRIDDKSILDATSAGKAQAGRSAPVSRKAASLEGAGASAAPADSVSSSTRYELSLKALSAGTSRAEQLERLQAEVEAGRYRPDPLAVSRAIVAESLQAFLDEG